MPKKSKGPPKRPAPLRQEKPKQQNKGEPLEPEPEPGPRTPTPRPIRKNEFSRYHIEELPENLRLTAEQEAAQLAQIGAPKPWERIEDEDTKDARDGCPVSERRIIKRRQQQAEIREKTEQRKQEERERKVRERKARERVELSHGRPPPRPSPPKRRPPPRTKSSSSKKRRRRGTRRNRRISRRKITRKKKRTN